MGADRREVVVVGAGIVGASCAHHLAARGVAVTVVERDESPASGSTGLSAAGVRVQFVEPVNVALSLESIAAYREFESTIGVDSGYRPVGYLFLVPHEGWDEHLAGVHVQRQQGAPVEVLDLEVALERFGGFSPDGLAGATFGPIDGIVDPHSVTMGYLGVARRRGVELRLRTEVVAIDRADDDWVLTLERAGERETLRAGHVVNAAGAWAGALGALAGLDVPVEPGRRDVWMTAPRAGRATTPLVVDVASGLYHRSEGERVLFGRSNPSQPPGFLTGIDWDFLEPTLEVAMDRFPWFADEELDAGASWYGYYEMTPDHNAVLGRHPDAQTWVDATGFSGHGVQQAPAVGRAIAEEVVEGRARSVDIDPLRLERFRTGARRHERHVI